MTVLIRTLLGLVGLMAGFSTMCHAGTIYKCIRADGTSNYGHERLANAECTVFGHYPDKRTAKSAGPPPSTIQSNVVDGAAHADQGKAIGRSRGQRPRTRSTGQFYAYIQDGVRHYTSARPELLPTIVDLRTVHNDVIETCFACAKAQTLDFHTIALNTTAYQSEIARASVQFGVEQALIRAIIHAESAFNSRALSRAGAQGLMQLMPATAQRFGTSNGFDASANIQAGVQYLSWLLNHFHGDLRLVSAGYNAGEAAVEHFHGVPPYDETRRYVERVAILLDRYRQALARISVESDHLTSRY